MTARRNPIRDKIAIVGVGRTRYSRDAGEISIGALAAEASRAAIRDAALTRHDVDGVVSTGLVGTGYLQYVLGIDVSWFDETAGPVTWGFADAIGSIVSGACDVALVCHSVYRTAANSRSAANDPLRRPRSSGRPDLDVTKLIRGPRSAAAWAARYLHDFNRSREDFALLAVNGRSNAAANPQAALREPITVSDYMAAPMVLDPLCMLDMDLPVDGADAFVLTTAERARELGPHVLIHATSFGRSFDGDYREQNDSLQYTGCDRVMEGLWQKSHYALEDVDIFFPYDGFTIYSLLWIEAAGYCQRGEGSDFIRASWDAATQRLKLRGRVPVNSHGGSLSEGASQGAGHIREAVNQLRGEAMERQVPDCNVALVTPGGAFHNASAMIMATGEM
jgi:acetyl-CoA acetyltransferase